MVISITTKYDQMYVDTFGIIQTQTLQCFPYGNKVIETDVHSTGVTPDTWEPLDHHTNVRCMATTNNIFEILDSNEYYA